MSAIKVSRADNIDRQCATNDSAVRTYLGRPQRSGTACATRAFVALAALSLASLPPVAGASTLGLGAFVSTVDIGAFAVNTDFDPGISRQTNGSAPLSDSAAVLYGLGAATSAASVSAGGLHSSAVHADVTNLNTTAVARSFASLVNPFMLVPRAGFVGTFALFQLPYSLGGSLDLFPTLASCPNCASTVAASLGVDGMDGLSFSAIASQASVGNPTFALGSVSRSGVLEFMLPVNTPHFVSASLRTFVVCQASPASCGADALFADTLSYTGVSDDADIVWALNPETQGPAPVPEPSTWLLLGAGLLVLVVRRSSRNAGSARVP